MKICTRVMVSFIFLFLHNSNLPAKEHSVSVDHFVQGIEKLEENLKEVHMAACKIAALLSRFHIISSMIGQILLQGHSVPIQINVIKIAHILIRKHMFLQ